MISGYDHWILNGPRQRCDCGRHYYAVDGPCHLKCDYCKKIFEIDEIVDTVCLDCLKARSDKAIDEAIEAGL